VFADPAKRRQLEDIVHPAVREATDAWYAHLEPTVRFAVADIPLLYETGRERDFERVVVVACEPGTQVKRVMERDHLSEAEAQQRIRSQLPISEKVRRADYVIRTEGSFADTDMQIRGIVDQLRGIR
jgi:dephospho-CoA kinase